MDGDYVSSARKKKSRKEVILDEKERPKRRFERVYIGPAPAHGGVPAPMRLIKEPRRKKRKKY